ncbi:MAG: hypothetical protein MPN21_14070 [Thermoanaerobaculia bacterium]|nr:hypothetical protein [Thermoanaerobaculia bacterium]
MTSDRWQLTAESLDALLDALDADRDEAARIYERIRSRLVHLFRWRGCSEPEELVDETLNRVARKLADGLEIRAEDPFRYVIGVAHKVFHEILRHETRRQQALREAQHSPDPDPMTDGDRIRLRCLDRCLERLGDDRHWILRFYQGEKGVRIRNRKHLATELGITANALRIRAHRLRSRLEDCVRRCVTGSSGPPRSSPTVA